jgi:hypothetical protein
MTCLIKIPFFFLFFAHSTPSLFFFAFSQEFFFPFKTLTLSEFFFVLCIIDQGRNTNANLTSRRYWLKVWKKAWTWKRVWQASNQFYTQWTLWKCSNGQCSNSPFWQYAAWHQKRQYRYSFVVSPFKILISEKAFQTGTSREPLQLVRSYCRRPSQHGPTNNWAEFLLFLLKLCVERANSL